MLHYCHLDFLAALLGLHVKVLFGGFDLGSRGMVYWLCYHLELLLLTNLKTVIQVAWCLICTSTNWRFLSRRVVCSKNQVSRLE